MSHLSFNLISLIRYHMRGCELVYNVNVASHDFTGGEVSTLYNVELAHQISHAGGLV